MPKNRFGGKHAKKGANKKMNDGGFVKSLPLPEEAGTYFAKITKRCGDGRFQVEYLDDHNNLQEGLAVMPGSMRRITRNVREGSFVIFQGWGFSENDPKGSILHLYSDQEVVVLSQSGALQGLLTEGSNLINVDLDRGDESENCHVKHEDEVQNAEIDFDEI